MSHSVGWKTSMMEIKKQLCTCKAQGKSANRKPKSEGSSWFDLVAWTSSKQYDSAIKGTKLLVQATCTPNKASKSLPCQAEEREVWKSKKLPKKFPSESLKTPPKPTTLVAWLKEASTFNLIYPAAGFFHFWIRGRTGLAGLPWAAQNSSHHPNVRSTISATGFESSS